MPTGQKLITDENEDAAFADVGGEKILKVIQAELLHDDYKAFDISLTDTEQEIDLGGTFTNFAVSIVNGPNVELKLNVNTNDIIVIGSQGQISHDKFAVSKFFIKTVTGTSKATIFATRKL